MDSIAAREAMLKSGMDHGVREGHKRLDELLGGQQSDSVDRHTETGY